MLPALRVEAVGKEGRMIYRVQVTGELATKYFTKGTCQSTFQIGEGLPPGCALFAIYPGEQGVWKLLFEGKPDDGTQDIEGFIKDIVVIYHEKGE